MGRMAGRERHQAALEVRLLSELSHPNIIAYYGTVFNRRRQVLEIYMEYAEGGTLADLIAEKQNTPGAKGFEEQTVIRWTRQMLSALRCVHKRRIIHRDLKPSNVFITHDGARAGARARAACGRKRTTPLPPAAAARAVGTAARVRVPRACARRAHAPRPAPRARASAAQAPSSSPTLACRLS